MSGFHPGMKRVMSQVRKQVKAYGEKYMIKAVEMWIQKEVKNEVNMSMETSLMKYCEERVWNEVRLRDVM